MEKNPGGLYLCYSSHLHPPPLPQGDEGIFLRSSPWEPSGVPGGKRPRNCGALLWLGPQVFFTHTNPHSASSNSSQLLVKLSGPTLTAPVASVVSLWMHLSLQISGCGLPWNFNSVMDLRKVHWFSVHPAFVSLWEKEWWLPSSLHVGVEPESNHVYF